MDAAADEQLVDDSDLQAPPAARAQQIPVQAQPWWQKLLTQKQSAAAGPPPAATRARRSSLGAAAAGQRRRGSSDDSAHTGPAPVAAVAAAAAPPKQRRRSSSRRPQTLPTAAVKPAGRAKPARRPTRKAPAAAGQASDPSPSATPCTATNISSISAATAAAAAEAAGAVAVQGADGVWSVTYELPLVLRATARGASRQEALAAVGCMPARLTAVTDQAAMAVALHMQPGSITWELPTAQRFAALAAEPAGAAVHPGAAVTPAAAAAVTPAASGGEAAQDDDGWMLDVGATTLIAANAAARREALRQEASQQQAQQHSHQVQARGAGGQVQSQQQALLPAAAVSCEASSPQQQRQQPRPVRTVLRTKASEKRQWQQELDAQQQKQPQLLPCDPAGESAPNLVGAAAGEDSQPARDQQQHLGGQQPHSSRKRRAAVAAAELFRSLGCSEDSNTSSDTDSTEQQLHPRQCRLESSHQESQQQLQQQPQQYTQLPQRQSKRRRAGTAVAVSASGPASCDAAGVGGELLEDVLLKDVAAAAAAADADQGKKRARAVQGQQQSLHPWRQQQQQQQQTSPRQLLPLSAPASRRASFGARGRTAAAAAAAVAKAKASRRLKARAAAAAAGHGSTMRTRSSRHADGSSEPAAGAADGAELAGAAAPLRSSSRFHAAGSERDAGTTTDSSRGAGWLARPDPNVAAAVAAAGIPCLAPGPGELRESTSRRNTVQAVACVSVFREGQATGHSAKLFRKVEVSDGGVAWEQLTTSCHDCQQQHVKWQCPDRQHTRSGSYCNRCLFYRYQHTPHSLADLHSSCPLCRGICTCRACLREAQHSGRVEAPLLQGPELQRAGQYLARVLAPHLLQWLTQQEQEAAAAGFAGLSSVPVMMLESMDRVNCDRCCANLIGLSARCGACQWDICCTCMQELREQQQQQHQHQQQRPGHSNRRAAAQAAQAAAPHRQFTWTCCSPTCPDVPSHHRLEPEDDSCSSLAGERLQCVLGGAPLHCLLQLPQDLVGGDIKASVTHLFERLHVLAQVSNTHSSRSHKQQQQQQQQPEWQQELSIADCPLLPSGAQLPLHAADGSVLTLQQLQGPDWWLLLPQVLQSSWRREAEAGRWLFCPAASDLEPSPEQRQQAAAMERCTLARVLFWARWLLGEPVVVRGCKGRIPWDPSTMHRATRDVRSDEVRVTVINCADMQPLEAVSAHTFFKGYSQGLWQLPNGTFMHAPPAAASSASASASASGSTQPVAVPLMLKVKDYPPDNDFRSELPRHFSDFLESRLPLPCMTDPRLGAAPLNLAAALQATDNPCDLGPKLYIATGRAQESASGGDSVTALHCDMTDAVNILVDTTRVPEPGALQQQPQQPQGQHQQQQQQQGQEKAGAVWDIFAHGDDTAKLSAWLSAHAADFPHMGVSQQPCTPAELAALGPINSQAFMLRSDQLAALQADTGVQPWRFAQCLDDAVFIPSGCPHQVRNLMSCTKVAVDFVSPDNLGATVAHSRRLRQLELAQSYPRQGAPAERPYAEKLQTQLTLVRAAMFVEQQQQCSGRPTR